MDKIIIRSEDRSIDYICKKILQNRWSLQSRFRQEFVWNFEQQSRVIESLILGIPIPSLYFEELISGQVVIFDGYHRLVSIYNFLNNINLLCGLTSLKGLNGLYFNELDAILKNRIEDSLVNIHLIDCNVSIEMKEVIFERLNKN